MTRPTVNITACTDGLSPRYTSLYPDGDRPSLSGGTAALEWVTNGTLAHGDMITVRTNVAGLFGEPDLRAQSLSMVGDETIVNGVSNNWLSGYANNQLLAGTIGKPDAALALDPNSPFYGVLGVSKTNVTRHANISAAYKCHAFSGLSEGVGEPGQFMWPAVFGNGTARNPDAGALCVATWVYYDFDNADEVNAISYSSKTGDFLTGANSKPTTSSGFIVGGIVEAGERVTVVNPSEKTAQGYVTLVDTTNSVVYINLDPIYPEWFNYEWVGATVTGQVSGAVLTIAAAPTVQLNEGAGKSARILQNPSVSLVNTATVIAGVSGGIGINVFYDATNDVTNATPLLPAPHTWHRRTIWVDYRTDVNGKIMCGHIIDNNTPQTCLIDRHSVRADIGPVLANWGIEENLLNGHTAIVGELKTYTDIMMCIISDSSTWAGVDYLNSEPLVAYGGRTDQEATFRLSRGVYSNISGKYLYILSDPMTPINTSGLLLSGA